jgi:hypothetical protein
MTVTLDRSVEEFIGAPRQLFIKRAVVSCGVGPGARECS